MDKLSKKQNLCEKLNMDLNEVNELFGEETLQSMQMAKVVGGNTTGFSWSGAWELVVKCLGIGSDFITIVNEAFTGSNDATISPKAQVTIESTKDGGYKIIVSGKINPITIIHKGDTTTITPTSTPSPMN